MIRTLYRAFKVSLFAYGVWNASKNSRWLPVAGSLWSMWRRRKGAARTHMAFVSAKDPMIYRRKGWRKLSSPRRPS